MSGVKVSFVGPGGVETFLDDPATGYHVTGPILGAYMPPALITSGAVFDTDGGEVQQVKFDKRTVGVPFAARADDQDSLRNIIRSLVSKTNPKLGNGRLRIYHEDGQIRDLVVRYSQGLDLPIIHNDPGEVWQEGEIDFIAYDPLWTDTADTTQTFGTSGAHTWFGSGYWFGPAGDGVGGFFDFGSSTVFADLEIDNPGDDLSFPVWTIRGPGANVILENLATGKKLDLSANGGVDLTDSTQILTIDTRPVVGGIVQVDSGGTVTNAFPFLTADSDLWPLVTGRNEVTVTMPGADDGSAITIAYRLRYLTP